jgi:hypothetical protein
MIRAFRWSPSTSFPTSLTDEVRLPLPVRPDQVQRYYEYRRCGTCNLFLHFEPLRGWRHVEVTAQRTTLDFAQQMRALVDVHYPEAERSALCSTT